MILSAVALSTAGGMSPVGSLPRGVRAVARACEGEVQVADEIVRRLRRLGINFTKTRLDRPYDPLGEIC